MSKILLSIHPIYANRIIKGEKKYEFRKRIAKNEVDTIVIYCTSPVKKVIGEAKVSLVLIDKPQKIWKLTKSAAGIRKTDFDKYFKDRKLAFAYELIDVKVFETPKDLSEYGIDNPPQSFVYLKL